MSLPEGAIVLPRNGGRRYEVFYVLQGGPQVLVAEEWISLERGGFVLIPRGVMHDFRNPSSEDAGLLNFFVPGGFERKMPAIVKWFAENR